LPFSFDAFVIRLVRSEVRVGQAGERYHEIDMLKGLACVLMLIGHALRAGLPPPDSLDKIVLHIMDFSGPIFFFVSGMNVMTFLERNRDKPGFRATKFYVAAAAVLFVLGFTYNLNRISPVMEIFQCVAACTVIVYLLMRTRLPAWAHWIIIVALYAAYLFAFRLPVEVAPRYEAFREARALIPAGSDLFRPGIGRALGLLIQTGGGWARLLAIHFAPLPWVTFFYVGALCYRSVTKPRAVVWPWWIFFAVLFVGGPFVGWSIFGPGKSLLDSIFLPSFLDLMLRGIPSYVLMTLGGAGLVYLASRRWYRGAGGYRHPVARWTAARFELLGRESFPFLIVHWWLISTVFLALHWQWRLAEARGGMAYELNPYARAALVTIGTVLVIPLFARVRDWLAARPHFATKALIVLAASFPASLVAFIITRNPEVALYTTYVASLSFAAVYPTLRGKLRAHYTAPAA
jgi:hypothetical protein